jgi:peptidoglycan hydrolase CwlO-like protein
MTQAKTFGLSVALAAALTAQPLATAGDVEKTPTPEQMAKDIKDIKEAQKKSSDALMDQLKTIQNQLEGVQGVRKDVDALKDAIRSLNSTVAQTQDMLKTTQLSAEIKATELAAAQAQLKQLRDDLEKTRSQAARMQEQITASGARCDGLTEELVDLRKKLADSSRQAARMTEPTGTIRLFNTYTQPVSIVLNGRSYQLTPGETTVLSNQPVGTVTYEVLGISPRTTRTLTVERPLDIEVFDLARGPIKTAAR